MMYLLTATELTPGGKSTVQYCTLQYGTLQYSTIHYSTVQYTFTHKQYRTTQLTTLVGRLSGIRTHSGQTTINDELRKNYRLKERVRVVLCLCELYSGICLTTEERAWT